MKKKGFKLWQELALGTAVIAAIGYGLLSIAPAALQPFVPQRVWTALGDGAVRDIAGGSPPCAGAADILERMRLRLAEGGGAVPDAAVDAYPVGVMNAWAVPGGRVVMTSELIARAETPEEVAGVLAHELGHIGERHAETQFIRLLGIGVLTGLGGNDGYASTIAVLSYSRSDEAEADRIALGLLHASAIDPAGFKAFLERAKAEEEVNVLGKAGELLSTHPVTQDRIDAITPLPPGVSARPVVTPEDWQTLKAACG